jgi:hypothetical protein
MLWVNHVSSTSVLSSFFALNGGTTNRSYAIQGSWLDIGYVLLGGGSGMDVVVHA